MRKNEKELRKHKRKSENEKGERHTVVKRSTPLTVRIRIHVAGVINLIGKR